MLVLILKPYKVLMEGKETETRKQIHLFASLMMVHTSATLCFTPKLQLFLKLQPLYAAIGSLSILLDMP